MLSALCEVLFSVMKKWEGDGERNSSFNYFFLTKQRIVGRRKKAWRATKRSILQLKQKRYLAFNVPLKTIVSVFSVLKFKP